MSPEDTFSFVKTEPIVGSALFKDLHELESNLYRWELVFKKVSIGHFHGALNVIELGEVQLIDARMSGTLFQYGHSPEGHVTFSIPAIDTHFFRWHHRNVGNSSLLLFPSNRELNAISYDGFHVYTHLRNIFTRLQKTL